MALLLEVKLIGSGWLPKQILDETDIRKACDNLVIESRFSDWRIRRIKKEDIVKVNAEIALQWS
jgi:hypothetical protein